MEASVLSGERFNVTSSKKRNESQMIITQVRDLPKEWPFREIVSSSSKDKTPDWIEKIYVFRPVDFPYKTVIALESIRNRGP